MFDLRAESCSQLQKILNIYQVHQDGKNEKEKDTCRRLVWNQSNRAPASSWNLSLSQIEARQSSTAAKLRLDDRFYERGQVLNYR